jgi:hypothetical protein
MEAASRSPHLQIRASAYNDDEVLAQVIDNGPGLENFEKNAGLRQHKILPK